jgi:serine/threonine-protein kinase ATR
MAPVDGHRLGSRVPGNGNMNARVSPSILAAQIAPVNGNALQNVDPRIFAQLIEECLSHDEDGQPRVGTDVAVNHRLICVIVKAGIDPASIDQDDPFKAQGRNSDQVTRCLEVIDIAIRRSPLVLYALSGTDDLGPEDHMVPLFAWLIPKLFSVICQGQGEHDAVSSKAWLVLSNLVASARTCAVSHGGCETVADYIANCASGMKLLFMAGNLCLLVNLELITQLHKLGFTTSASVLIYLSDASNFFADSLAKLRLHDSKLQSRIVVGNVPQTISTTSRLIGLSIPPNSKPSPISPVSGRKSLAYSLDQLRRLWQLIVLYINSVPQPRDDAGLLIVEFVQSLQAISSRIASLRHEMSLMQKCCLRWTVCIEDCLKMLVTGNEFMSQSLLNSVTESMLVTTHEIPEIVVALNEQLGPLTQNEDADPPLGPSKSNGHQVNSSLLPHICFFFFSGY